MFRKMTSGLAREQQCCSQLLNSLIPYSMSVCAWGVVLCTFNLDELLTSVSVASPPKELCSFDVQQTPYRSIHIHFYVLHH